MTQSATDNAMDRYATKVVDPTLKRALISHDLPAVEARGAELLRQHPAPTPSLLETRNRTPEQAQSALVSIILDTLRMTGPFDQQIETALDSIRK